MRKFTKSIPKFFLVVLVLMCTAFSALAQNTITGKVTDSKDGSPVAGVTVAVLGSKTVVRTENDGTFKVNVPANAILVFTEVGFAGQQIAVAGKSVVDVALVQTSQQLNEVVVVGYGTTRKKDLTGSVNVINAKDFQKGNITTPEQMIAGKVPGVSITSNGGQPGSGSTIRIRGGSSLYAGNDPLIVIDGVPLDHDGINGASNALSFINADDIESFTILKDASAAAIYGTRGSNGVIIITTKKGKAGELKMNFITTTSFATKTGNVAVLNGDQIRTIVNQLGTPSQKLQVGSSNTNWQDAIYHTAVSSENNLSFSGGINKLPYRVSLGYAYLNGILQTDRLQKTSVALVLNPTFLNNTLKVDINIKAIAEDTRFGNQGAIGGAVGFDPTQSIYSNSPRYGGYYEWVESNGELKLNRPNNPVGVLKETFDKQTPKRSIGSIQFDYAIPKISGLHANLNLAYDASKSTGTYFINDSAASAYVISKPGIGGSNNPNKQTKLNTVMDFYLNYIKDLPSIKSRIDFTAGYSFNDYKSTNYYYRAYNAKGDTIAGTKPPDYPSGINENVLIGIYGRLKYVYNEKYLLTATLRRDGSSRFGPDNKWGTFPSVALAWQVKNEDFMKNNKTFSDLKLRLGYGITGQQDGIGNYLFKSFYGLGSPQSSVGFGNNYYQPYAPSGYYPDLKWEQTEGYNLGIDYGFLKNRITGSVEFYLRKTKDLLNVTSQPAGANFSAYILTNVGNMDNKGVEFNITAIPVKKPNLSVEVGFNATYNKNTITNLTVVPNDPNYLGFLGGGAAGLNGFLLLGAVGGPKNTFYMYHQIYDANGQPIEGLFEDLNRDGIINDKDRYKSKAADPDLFFGFSTNVNYKNWSAGFVLRANFNNYVYNNVYSNLGKLTQVLDAYTIHNGSSNYLQTKFAGKTDIQGFSDYYLENASFLKMDNFNIGYNFGKVYHNKIGLRVNLTAQNVFVITKYKGLDPEVVGGVDNNLYPRPRIISLGANLDF